MVDTGSRRDERGRMTAVAKSARTGQSAERRSIAGSNPAPAIARKGEYFLEGSIDERWNGRESARR